MNTQLESSKDFFDTSLCLDYPEGFSEQNVLALTEGLDQAGVKLSLRPQPPTMWACIDLIIPGVISAALLVYGKSFLEEAGKDHYNMLKAWLGALAKRSHSIQVHTVTGTVSTEKLPSASPYSNALSVYYLTKCGNRVKLVGNKTMTSEQWEALTIEFVEIMHTHYLTYPNDRITELLQDWPQYEELLAVMDPVNGLLFGNWRAFQTPQNVAEGEDQSADPA